MKIKILMKDRKETIGTLKNILKGLEPVSALFDDVKPKHIIKVYIERDGKLFMGGEEVPESEYERIKSDPNVIHVKVKREAPTLENELPGPVARVTNANQ